MSLLSGENKLFKQEDCILFRDDGLGVTWGNGHEADKVRKELHKIFQKEGLTIKCECNLSSVEFLDAKLNLCNEKCSPYIKANGKVEYVPVGSNHPPKVVQNIPLGIEKRLNFISSDKQSFDGAKATYQNSLIKAGHCHVLNFQEQAIEENCMLNQSDIMSSSGNEVLFNSDAFQQTLINKRRKRNIIWFNPPYSEYIGTNVGKLFLKAVDQCFSHDRELYKLFNRHNMKISYKCGPNLRKFINSHNRNILNTFYENINSQLNTKKRRRKKLNNGDLCDCESQECPLQNKCLEHNMVYEASVIIEGREQLPPMKYVGLASTQFKVRFQNHVSTFNNFEKRKQSELSEFIWDLKGKNLSYIIKWRKIVSENVYSIVTGRCNLCLREKLEINKLDPKFSINKKTELFKQCLHKWKHKLSAFNYEKEVLKAQASDINLSQILNPETQTLPITNVISQSSICSGQSKMKNSKASQNVNLPGTSTKNSQEIKSNQSTSVYMTRKKARELKQGIIFDKL